MPTPEMADQDSRFEHMLVQNHALISRVATRLSRRGGIPAGVAEDFVSSAIARLIYDDYTVLRKFRGRGSLQGFLNTVFRHLLSDFRNEEWGRWRSSEVAKRLGPAAELLERLTYRDRLPVREAIRQVRCRFPGELPDPVAILTRLPRRWLPRAVPETSAAGVASVCPGTGFDREEQAKVTSHLEAVIAGLDPIDLELVRGMFWRNETVAKVARRLRLDQKSLYRRLDRLKLRFRDELKARGIDRETVLSVLGGAAA
ncbi:MAG: hypothetical protein ACKVZ0_06275 [Gemmatimonadales bacterium]